MTPTLFVARIDGASSNGPAALHLSLHTSYEGAVSGLLAAAGPLFRRRFDYIPEDLRPRGVRDAAEWVDAASALRRAADRLTGIGWRGSVEELPVELDAAEELTP